MQPNLLHYGLLTPARTNIYMVYCLSLLFLLFHPVKHNIGLSNGSSQPVLGKGVLHSARHYLYHLVSMPLNFLRFAFVSQLTKALHWSITVDPTSCVFQNLKTREMIGSGHEKDSI